VGSSLLLVGAMGCASSTPEPKTPLHTPHEQVQQAENTPTSEPTATDNAAMRSPQVFSETARYRAQQIYLKALDIFEQHEYDLAYLEFGRALDVYPAFYKAWFKKGLCAYYKQKYDLEIECYRRCLEIQPDYMEALNNLANAYLAQDLVEKAVPIYRKMLQIDPKHPVALYNLGICYSDIQDYHSAIEHLTRFVEAHPQDPSRTKADLLLKRVRQKLEAER